MNPLPPQAVTQAHVWKAASKCSGDYSTVPLSLSFLSWSLSLFPSLGQGTTPKEEIVLHWGTEKRVWLFYVGHRNSISRTCKKTKGRSMKKVSQSLSLSLSPSSLSRFLIMHSVKIAGPLSWWLERWHDKLFCAEANWASKRRKKNAWTGQQEQENE